MTKPKPKQGNPTHGAAQHTGINPTLPSGKPWRDPMAPEAEALIAMTIEVHDWLARPEFQSALRRWAFAEVRIERVQAWLDTRGLLDGRTGQPRPAALYLEKLESTAARARTALGFSPASFADIQAKVAQASGATDAALARLREQGAKGIAARQAELAAQRELEAARLTVDDLTPDLTREAITVEATNERRN